MVSSTASDRLESKCCHRW